MTNTQELVEQIIVQLYDLEDCLHSHGFDNEALDLHNEVTNVAHEEFFKISLLNI